MGITSRVRRRVATNSRCGSPSNARARIFRAASEPTMALMRTDASTKVSCLDGIFLRSAAAPAHHFGLQLVLVQKRPAGVFVRAAEVEQVAPELGHLLVVQTGNARAAHGGLAPVTVARVVRLGHRFSVRLRPS